MTMKGIGLALCLYVSACAMVEHLSLLRPLMIAGIIMLSSRIREGDSLGCDTLSQLSFTNSFG